MFNKFLPNSKIFYLNDRHEEADTDKEDRRKLYDKRILPLLEENDFAVFGDKIDNFLWDYYRGLGLTTINRENIFYESSYLSHKSLTSAILHNRDLLERLKQEKFETVIPYIESSNTEILAEKTGASLLRPADFTEWINNKTNYRKILDELKLPIVSGFTVRPENAEGYFGKLKEGGFKRVVLKRERSVSGFGVFVAESENDFSRCLNDNFEDGEDFILEGFIENIKCSPNFQYFITGNDIIFVVATDQILEDDGVSYSGNIYPSSVLAMPDILEKISAMSEKICRYLQKNKCFGIVGIDYIATGDGEVYSSEANVRVNGSTFPALIAEKLFGEDANIHWLFKTFHFKPLSFERLFGQFDYFLRPGGDYGVFPVGVDLLESIGEGQFMIIANSRDKLYDLYHKFSHLCSEK